MGWREELELDHIERDIHGVFRLLERVLDNQEQIMATQAEVDAVTAEIGLDVNGLVTSTQAIKDEIAAIQAANPAVDLSGLQAAVASLDSAAGGVAGIATPAPAPAPPADQPPADQPPAATPPADQPPTEQPAT